VGHGFVESVYERALADALSARNLGVDQQTSVSVWLHGRKIGHFSSRSRCGGRGHPGAQSPTEWGHRLH
jgi:hypothetical protein